MTCLNDEHFWQPIFSNNGKELWLRGRVCIDCGAEVEYKTPRIVADDSQEILVSDNIGEIHLREFFNNRSNVEKRCGFEYELSVGEIERIYRKTGQPLMHRHITADDVLDVRNWVKDLKIRGNKLGK